MDGERTQLLGKDWLSLEAPAGGHSFQFRYQPWDVIIGIFLSLIGALLSIYFWRSVPKDQTPPEDHSLPPNET